MANFANRDELPLFLVHQARFIQWELTDVDIVDIATDEVIVRVDGNLDTSDREQDNLCI